MLPVLQILRRYMFAVWFLEKKMLIQIRKYSYIGKILGCDLKHLDHKKFLFKLKGITQASYLLVFVIFKILQKYLK